MAFYVGRCNHCSTDKIKFNALSYNFDEQYNTTYFFIVCENCVTPTTISMQPSTTDVSDMLEKNSFPLIRDFNINDFFYNEKIINTPNNSLKRCPDHVPDNLKSIFDEAAKCYSHNCYIACSSMFRLCLDVTTKELLSQYNNDQNENIKIDKLFNRIEFLVEKNIIPNDLKDFIHNIRLDGNDAAHDGNTRQEEAEDLLDFSELFLERIYTMKKQLELAQARRLARRNK